jgi:hypothetical protein
MDQPVNSLLLADGTILENSSCGAAGRDLWCWVPGKSLAECFSLFNDAAKTREITISYTTEKIKYIGYTEFILIRKTEDSINIRMTWPEGGDHSIVEIPIEKPVTEDDANE